MANSKLSIKPNKKGATVQGLIPSGGAFCLFIGYGSELVKLAVADIKENVHTDHGDVDEIEDQHVPLL